MQWSEGGRGGLNEDVFQRLSAINVLCEQRATFRAVLSHQPVLPAVDL
jgi:hypothetical protein